MKKVLSLLAAGALSSVCLASCGGSTPPKSTTTTTSQTTTTTDDGQKATVDSKEVKTEQADGSQKVERTESSTKVVPPPTPAPSPQ